ncbi:MAG: arylsulfatase A-like enzyme [Candidatus Pelagisphaera sp.]|jgi:arylsulfatase A-like enzyme
MRVLGQSRSTLSGIAPSIWAIYACSVFMVLGFGERPNIVLIMADDLGYGDLGCYGQAKIQTPNIDALARGGIRFKQAYAGGPVCTSSRSVLMTGLHNGHTPARDNVPHYNTYLKDGDVTIAEVLKSSGYRCGGIGKWSLGDPGTEGDATKQGFDMWFGYQNQDHAHYYFPEYLDDSEAEGGRAVYPGNSQSRSVYSHDVMTDRALEFIEESAEAPFFFYAAYTVPHFSNKSEDPDRLSVPSLGEYADKPWSLAAKKYAAMVSRLDRDVGLIVDLIEKLWLSENTMIIFTSDQGPFEGGPSEELNSNGPLRGAKRSLYEGGIRVPFIVRWNGRIPAGETSDEVIAFWDMLPTLSEVAEVRLVPHGDGQSVLDAFLGKPLSEKRDYLYWDYGHSRKRYDQAVRLGDWKGIRLGMDEPIQLYHLIRDPGEARNVASQNSNVVNRVAAIMKTAAEPDDRYEIGKRYNGKPIWKPTWTEE